MSDSSPYELPNPSEKLSYKFILDGLKEKQAGEAQVEPEPEPGAALSEPVRVDEADAPLDEAAIPALELPPDKKYFRIGEVAELIGVEPYVLRYWEGEFSTVRPTKSRSGQRIYARKDVESLHQIQHLLHVEKFSIKGAKKKLQEQRRQAREQHDLFRQKHRENLKRFARELRELIEITRSNPGLG